MMSQTIGIIATRITIEPSIGLNALFLLWAIFSIDQKRERMIEHPAMGLLFSTLSILFLSYILVREISRILKGG